MAKERDLKREAELAKARGEKVIGIKTTIQVVNDFDARCANRGTSKAEVLKKFILEYTYGERANEVPASVGQKRKTPDRDLER